MTKKPHSNDPNTSSGLSSTGEDKPECKQVGREGSASSPEELQLLIRALRAINQCNQSLIHASDEQEFLDQICEIVVDIGGYRMAWVGYAENDTEKSIRRVAQAGFEKDYLRTIQVTWADVECGRDQPGRQSVQVSLQSTVICSLILTLNHGEKRQLLVVTHPGSACL